MSEYLIAAKRNGPNLPIPDWPEFFSEIQGAVLKNVGRKGRVRVVASPEAITEIRSRLADSYVIEPVFHHEPVILPS